MRISVIICSRNRQKLAQTCLQSLAQQTHLPDEVIFIEDTAEHQFFSASILQEILDSKVQIQYVPVKNRHIVYSRNIGLKKAKHPLLLFVDDDVILKEDVISTVIKLHHKYPKIAAFVGQMKSIDHTLFAEFGSLYMMQELHLVKKAKKEITFFVTALLSVKKNALQRHNLFFRDQYHLTGEDIDFTLRLHEAGEQLFFHPQIICWHLFKKNFFGFCRTQFSYAQSFAFLAADHPAYIFLTPYLPQSRRQVLILPIFCLIKSWKNGQDFCQRMKLNSRFQWPAFVQQLVFFAGIYSSNLGRKKVISHCAQLFSLN